MLGKRIVFGSLLTVLFCGVFWLDAAAEGWSPGGIALPPGIVMLAMVILAAPIAARELAGVCRAKGADAHPALIALGAIALAACAYPCPWAPDSPASPALIFTILIAVLFIAFAWHCRKKQTEGALAAGGGTLLSAVYLGVGGGSMLAIRQEHAAWAVLAVVVVTKMGDTGAYFTGRAIGKHKLIPWLSPGKTWQGLGGAIAFSAGAAAAAAWIAGDPYCPGMAAIAGVALAVVGHAGDLTMSLLKRDAGIKDSGNLIPGMGGVMDVFDSPLLALPVAFWLLKLVAMG